MSEGTLSDVAASFNHLKSANDISDRQLCQIQGDIKKY